MKKPTQKQIKNNLIRLTSNTSNLLLSEYEEFYREQKDLDGTLILEYQDELRSYLFVWGLNCKDCQRYFNYLKKISKREIPKEEDTKFAKKILKMTG